jgi:hypothetical protein
MNNQKAAYWLALAVFGLVLHSEYRHGSFPAVHRAADRASFMMCRVAAHAERAIALAKRLTVRPAPGTDDLPATAEAKELAAAQADMVREHVQNSIELHRDLALERAELLGDQTRTRAEMIRALAELRRAQFDEARSQMRSQILIGDAANRRLIAVRPYDCKKTATRVAIIAAHVSSDGDTDSEQD